MNRPFLTLPLLALTLVLASCVSRRTIASRPPEVTPASNPQEEIVEIPNDRILLKRFTLVQLITTETVSSAGAKPGDRVHLRVVGDVRAAELVVIANGAPALGTVVEVRKAGMAWHPGEIAIRLDSVTLVDGQQVSVEPTSINAVGEPNQPSEEGLRGLIQMTGGAGALALPFLPLQHGKQAMQPRGTVVIANVQSNTLLERTSIEAAQPKTPGGRENAEELDQRTASLTIFYPEDHPKGAITVWCGTAKLGKVNRGRRLTVNLPAGTYWLRSNEREASYPLPLEAGRDYYLEVYSPQQVLRLVDHHLGEAEASITTAPADPKDTRDISKIALAALQAHLDD